MDTHKTIRIELHYFPSIQWMKQVIHANTLEIEACENYQKGSYRNRAYFPGPNGQLLLSLPLVHGKNQHTTIQEVKLANNLPWKREQWKSLTFMYRSSPYFEYYEDELKELFDAPNEFLFDWSYNLTAWMLKKFGFKGTLQKSSHFKIEDPNTINLRNKIKPGFSFEDNPVYFQLFEDRNGFFPNMSALDLLFMEGPAARDLLMKD